MSILVEPEKKKGVNAWIFLVLLLVVVFGYPYWHDFAFNLVFIGYNWFGDMRLASVFFAVILRAIMYPLRIMGLRADKQIHDAEKLNNRISEIDNSIERKTKQRVLLSRYKWALVFLWFNTCFFIMNAYAVHVIFVTHFSPETVQARLYPFVQEPAFPLVTNSYIPVINRMVDLTKPSALLDLYASIGAALTGAMEVIIHKKHTKRDVLLYLVCYPLVAFNLNWVTKAGFEWTLICFEVLTVALIILEKIVSIIWGSLRTKPETAALVN